MKTRVLLVTKVGSADEYVTAQSVILGDMWSASNTPELRDIEPVTLLIEKVMLFSITVSL